MSRMLLSLVLGAVWAAAQVDTAWVRRWDGVAHCDDWAMCMALDSSGNVLVAGVTSTDTILGHYDFITLKYTPQGELLWARQYGTVRALDRPYAIAVARTGHVYVAGESNGQGLVLKYDSAGHLIRSWVMGIRCYGLALDTSGNVYVCGASSNATVDFLTARLRPNGECTWVRTLNWGPDNDWAHGVAVDRAGRVVVAGTVVQAESTHCDIGVVVYDSLGGVVWSASYDGPRHGVEQLTALATDRDGNIIVAGSGDNGYGTLLDYLTIKFSPEGETLWVRRYNGPAYDDDRVSAMAVDTAGRVYVTGTSSNFPVSATDYFTVCYDALGHQLWGARYNSPYNGIDKAHALALDNAGNVYVTGGSDRGLHTPYDCLTAAYSRQGDTLWTRRYDGPASLWDNGTTIVVSDRGEIYVAGVSDGDVLLIKYVRSGGVTEARTGCATRLWLSACPNPMRSRAVVRYGTASAGPVSLRVLDATGRMVARLVDAGPANGRIFLSRTGCRGEELPAGVYTLEARSNEGERATLKILLLP